MFIFTKMHAKDLTICKAFFSLISANALTNVHRRYAGLWMHQRRNSNELHARMRTNDKQSISILLGMSESFQAGKNRHSSHAGDTTTPSECLPIQRWLGCCCCSCQYYTDHMPFHNNKNNNDINCNNNNSNSNSIIRKEYSDWMEWVLTKWNCMYTSSLKSY